MKQIKKALLAIYSVCKKAKMKISGLASRKKRPKGGDIDEYNYTIF